MVLGLVVVVVEAVVVVAVVVVVGVVATVGTTVGAEEGGEHTVPVILDCIQVFCSDTRAYTPTVQYSTC